MSLKQRDMQTNAPSELPSSQKRSFWRAVLDSCVAIDTLTVVLLCAGAVVLTVVTLNAELLILAVVGIFVMFVLGCLIFGIKDIGRNR